MPDMSFLPEDYLEKRLQRRTNLICVSLFVVVMAAVVAAALVTDRQRTEVRALQEKVNNDFAEAAKRLEQLETLQARKQQMMNKARVTATLLERVPRSLILSELTNLMPATLSLTELGLETRVVRASQSLSMTALEKAKAAARANGDADAPPEIVVPETEVLMQLEGTAPTDVEVAQFMAALGQCPLFKDVNLAFSEEVTLDERNQRRFRVDLALNQDIDLKRFEPARVARNGAGNDAGLKINPMGKTVNIAPLPAINVTGTNPQGIKPAVDVMPAEQR